MNRNSPEKNKILRSWLFLIGRKQWLVHCCWGGEWGEIFRLPAAYVVGCHEWYTCESMFPSTPADSILNEVSFTHFHARHDGYLLFPSPYPAGSGEENYSVKEVGPSPGKPEAGL